jgi:hypothetical protein
VLNNVQNVQECDARIPCPGSKRGKMNKSNGNDRNSSLIILSKKMPMGAITDRRIVRGSACTQELLRQK